MKHNWEYKKLGEICDIINGLWTGKKPPFVKVGVIRNTNFTKSCTLDDSDIFYTDVEEKAYSKRKLQKGDIIIEKSGGSEKQPVGRPILFGLDGEYSFSNFTSTLRINNGSIIPSFLHKVLVGLYFQGKTRPLQSKTTGLHNLDFNKYLRFSIPVPPLPIQQQIVDELDKLSEIIEKKKQQVKELDTLAQAIFYDMFGDPVENEKGWEVKKFADVGELIRGGGFLKSDFVESGVPCIHYGQIHMKFGPFVKEHLTEIPVSVTAKSKIASRGDVVIAITSEDVEGSCKCTAWMGDYDIFVGAHAAIYKHNQDPIYVSYYIKSSGFQTAKQKYVHGIKVMEIKPSDIGKIDILLPPLPLQQSFAKKIEAIEKQKELINQSIKETQTLFDSRMDYYFGE